MESRPDSILCYVYRQSTDIGLPAGLRPAGGPILVLSRKQAGQNPAPKSDFRPGSIIAYHRVDFSFVGALESISLGNSRRSMERLQALRARGCSFGGNYEFVKGRKSVIFGLGGPDP